MAMFTCAVHQILITLVKTILLLSITVTYVVIVTTHHVSYEEHFTHYQLVSIAPYLNTYLHDIHPQLSSYMTKGYVREQCSSDMRKKTRFIQLKILNSRSKSIHFLLPTSF